MNVVVVLADSLRRDFLGAYGNSWIQTPNIDRLAAMGTVFDQAWVGSYPCMPARRDLWTGAFEFPTRGWGPLEASDPSLPYRVSRAEHKAMLVTDHWHLWQPGSGNYHFGFSGTEFIRGQERDPWILNDDEGWYAETLGPNPPAGHQADPEVAWGQYRRNTRSFQEEAHYFPAQVMTKAMDWLDANRNTRDFFLLIDQFDPHEPFDPPEPYRSLYRHGDAPPSHIWPTYGKTKLTPEEVLDVRGLYAGSLTLVDKWIGKLIDKLEELQLLSNTVVVVMTDHGHLLGEHGLVGKPWAGLADSNLYQELVHVPLIIYHPEAKAQRSSSFVQIADLYPTILDFLGIKGDRDGGQSTSLADLVMGTGSPKDHRTAVCYGRFGEALNVTSEDGTLMTWWEPDPNRPTTHYWYGLNPPLFPEHVHLTGSLMDNQRWPVDVSRGASQSAIYAASDGHQQTNMMGTPEGERLRRQLMKELKQFLARTNAPEHVYERYQL